MNWPQHQFKFISKNGKKLARNKSKKINRKRLSGLSAGQIYYPRHRRCKKSITSSINRSNAPITSSCKINVHKRNPWKGMRIPSFFLPSFLRPSIPRPHPFSSSFFFFLSQNATSTIPSIDFSRVLAKKRERERDKCLTVPCSWTFFPTKTRKRLQQHRRFSQLLPFSPPCSPAVFPHAISFCRRDFRDRSHRPRVFFPRFL